jgi:uncharacterized membrane protein YcaP (DUF421 family)
MEFDRIFLGDFSLELVLEIVLRTAVMYLFTLGLIRVLGKRGMGELSPFELVIIVALGSAVGDPMFYADVPLIHGIIVITVVVALERALVKATERHEGIERLIESEPVCVVHDGELVLEAMDHEDLSKAEIFMALREHGIEFLEEVRRAYLEPSGEMSVFRNPSPPRLACSILPEEINAG